MSNAFYPSAQEIGNPFAAMERAKAFRRRMFRNIRHDDLPVDRTVRSLSRREITAAEEIDNEVVQEKPKKKPVKKPLAATVRPNCWLDKTIYIRPIKGPCQPHEPFFPYYNGERDILHISTQHLKQVFIMDCIAWCVEYFGISYDDIVSERRLAPIVRARQAAMYLARQFTVRSTTEIARQFGDRDHTTLIHGVKRAKALVDSGQWVPPSYDDMMQFRARHKGR